MSNANPKEKAKPMATFGMSGQAMPKPVPKPVEQAAAEEMEEFRLAGKGPRTGLEQLKKAEAQFWAAVDTEFWFAVCFQSREQKDAFLNATGWGDLGSKHMDGTELAKRMGIGIPEVRGEMIHSTIKASLRELAMEPGKGHRKGST